MGLTQQRTLRSTVAPLPWYGGKSRLAATLVDMLPQHSTYVEPFGGAGAVLFTKQPCTLEVYNDVHSGLVTFFRVLRDRPDELVRALRLTPYSREEFAHCVETWEQVADDVERARRWYVRCRQAFASSAATVGWGFEIDGSARGGTRARSFATAVDGLEWFADRLRRVQIENLDWRQVLERYDGPGVCFYLDPPYHPATRGEHGLRRNSAYVHELTEADHIELVGRALQLEGSVVISGYDHPVYTRLQGGGLSQNRACALQQRLSHPGRARAPHGDRVDAPRARRIVGSDENRGEPVTVAAPFGAESGA